MKKLKDKGITGNMWMHLISACDSANFRFHVEFNVYLSAFGTETRTEWLVAILVKLNQTPHIHSHTCMLLCCSYTMHISYTSLIKIIIFLYFNKRTEWIWTVTNFFFHSLNQFEIMFNMPFKINRQLYIIKLIMYGHL